MEGGSFGFPFGGDPEDLLRGIQEFAAQQAESVQEAQREQFATLTLSTAVELTAAALKQVQPSGSIDEQAVALRDAMRVLFPEAVALVSAARQGFMRESPLGSRAVSLLDRAVVTLLPAVPKAASCGSLRRGTSPGPSSTTRAASSRQLNAERQARDRRRPRRGSLRARARPRRSRRSTSQHSTPSNGITSTRTSASSRPGSA